MNNPPRRLLPLVLIALWLLCQAIMTVGAQAANPAAVPELPPSLLVDETNTLSTDDKDALADRLQAIQKSGRAQVAILVSREIGDEVLAAYSLRVAEAWRLGHAGRNDGLLVVVIPSLPAARIEVGYGLEGAIPDARASQWLDDLIPATRRQELGAGLNRLLDRIDEALPQSVAKDKARPDPGLTVLDTHPEWKLPFVLVVFSPLALFPLFLHRRGYVGSGPLVAAFWGMAAGALWDSRAVGLTVAACALPLPYLWSLNTLDSLFGPSDAVADRLAPWRRYARAFGNVVAVVLFFAVITMFVGVGLQVGQVREIWVAPIFSGLLAIGLAVFLFPGKPARYLMIVLHSVMFFVFLLAVAYFGLQPLVGQPTGLAVALAATATVFVEFALYLDHIGSRWSPWLCGLSLLAVVPFALLALVRAAVGDDLTQQLVQAVAGGGALTGVGWLAARIGFFTAVKVGMGGLFGGGGAERG